MFKAFLPIYVKEVAPSKFWASEGRALIASKSFTYIIEGILAKRYSVSANKKLVSGIKKSIPQRMIGIVYFIEMPLQQTDHQKAEHPKTKDLERFNLTISRSRGLSKKELSAVGTELNRV